MVDHSPWRDLDASLETLSRLPDQRVLRNLSSSDEAILQILLGVSGRGDDVIGLLLHGHPAWCVRTAVGQELSTVREWISGARVAAESGERSAFSHPGFSLDVRVDLTPVDGDDLTAVDNAVSALRQGATAVSGLVERAGLPLLTLLLAPNAETNTVEQLLDRQPRLVAQRALRTLIGRAWPSGTVDLGADVLSAEVRGARNGDRGLTLEILRVRRGATGFEIRLRPDFGPEAAMEAKALRARSGVSRSYLWPGPITATDAADQMYALVDRRTVSSTTTDTVSIVDLTYRPALDPAQMSVRLCCDRYDIQEFEIRPPGGERPVRTVTEQVVDLCVEVPFPPIPRRVTQP